MNTQKFAIVSMDCVLPGANGLEEFWEVLDSGRDARSADDPRLHFANTDPAHQITSTHGGFLSPELRDELSEVEGVPADADDATRWATFVSRRALNKVSGKGLDLGRTGMYLGCYTFPTTNSAELSLQSITAELSAGFRAAGEPAEKVERPEESHLSQVDVAGVAAEYTANALGLGGPRLALDAACASGLYALRLACDALAAGEADTMVAGAVCAPEMSLLHVSFSDLGAYGDAPAAPFTAGSPGITTGEGAAVVVVRRLADAVADENTILAVVDSVALSNDGTGKHLLAPSPAGQHATYSLAFDHNDVMPEQIDYVECHATGTPLGDKVELESLTSFFGDNLPLLGSVKGNIGHLLTAAGVSSLIKVVLAMNEGVLPATVGAGGDARWLHPNVVHTRREWPAHNGPRRAGVSAFGFGGANAHVVVSQPTAELTAAETSPTQELESLRVTGMGAFITAGHGVNELVGAEWKGDFSPLRSDLVPPRVAAEGEEFGTFGPIPVNPIADRIPRTT